MKITGILIGLLLSFALISGVTLAQDDDGNDVDADVDVSVDAPDVDLSDEEGTVEIGEPVSEDADPDIGGVDLDEQSPIELWEALAGMLLPILVGLVNRQGWTVQYKNGALFVLSVVVAAAGLYFQGDLDRVEDWVTTIMTLLLIAFGSYKTLWQMLPLPQFVESKTGGDPMEASSYRVARS
jgi:hypothetical protein